MTPNNNMYRVGDFVYFESTPGAPFQIRRIDELAKNNSGVVEAKVTCFYRRRDIPKVLLSQVKNFYKIFDSETDDEDDEKIDDKAKSTQPPADTKGPVPSSGGDSSKKTTFTKDQRSQIRHRELFLSRQTQHLPATHIRGKCSVTLFNGVEPITNYLSRDDAFYYKLVYDPNNKTLQEDRGALRIGSEFQCPIQALLKEGEKDPRMTEIHESLVWDPTNDMEDKDFELINTLTKAVGTYARGHDLGVPLRQGPLLLEAVTGSSRDITRQFIFDLIHKAEYSLEEAVRALVPGGQPILIRDQLEEWSPSEHALFEEGFEKYSKSFGDIRSELLPWKTHTSLVEMYYFWKTTDRYVKRRRTKLAAQEHKLKQVYIPNYNKPNQTVLYHNMLLSSVTMGQMKANVAVSEPKECQSCKTPNSSHWYGWSNDPANSTSFSKICNLCWFYWKRYGGLKGDKKIEITLPGISDVDMKKMGPAAVSASLAHLTTQNGSVLRGGGTHCLITPISLRLTRHQAKDLLELRRISRKPGRIPESIKYEGKFDDVLVDAKIKEIITKLIAMAKEKIGDDDGKKTTEEIKSRVTARDGKVKRSSTDKRANLIKVLDKVAGVKKIQLSDAKDFDITVGTNPGAKKRKNSESSDGIEEGSANKVSKPNEAEN